AGEPGGVSGTGPASGPDGVPGGPGAGPDPGSVPGAGAHPTERWARERHWPRDAAHALCVPLRSRGRTLGVVTFLRAAPRPPFTRPDVAYAESVAARAAACVDLARLTGRSED
ncbi:GAF domain-containing protein, partial [Streptomyces sp. MUM 203J]|uniref:GAF domain-containing protein n=1 Tax=Streptomyces sp. MUM 203J TaxID=2791990 RepID=UPI001F03D1B0